MGSLRGCSRGSDAKTGDQVREDGKNKPQRTISGRRCVPGKGPSPLRRRALNFGVDSFLLVLAQELEAKKGDVCLGLCVKKQQRGAGQRSRARGRAVFHFGQLFRAGRVLINAVRGCVEGKRLGGKACNPRRAGSSTAPGRGDLVRCFSSTS